MAQRGQPRISLTPEQKFARKKKILAKFRAIIRSVIANIFWLQDVDDTKLGDDVQKNIELLTRKKIKKSTLKLEEKSIMSKPTTERTEEEKLILDRAIGWQKCFRKYPLNVRSQLSAVAYFAYIGTGRDIVRQNHKPSAMYFLLSGEILVTVKSYDKYLDEWIETESGVVGEGTMIGELALLHGLARLATITTISPCELLVIYKEDFDLVLRETVLKAWEEIVKIINKYSYFNNWDAVTKRECSIMSRIKTYAPDEIVLGDGSGNTHNVHFITKGYCYIIESIVLRVYYVNGFKKYQLHDPEIDEKFPIEDDISANRHIMAKYFADAKDTLSEGDNDSEILSILTRTNTGENLKIENEATQNRGISFDNIYDTEASRKKYTLETHFIKLCDLTEGACFNIGESMKNRRIVSKTETNCLLVPRYWILKNNKDNIWNRVQQFLTKNIPNQNKVFRHFLDEQKFMKYRQSLLKDLMAEKNVSNTNSIHNVPYSIRLKENRRPSEYRRKYK